MSLNESGDSLHSSCRLQLGSELGTSQCVHVQKLDGRPSFGAKTNDARPLKREMVWPEILPGMEQGHESPCL